ncbi:hypothetical protein [Thermodesulfovibrio sp.]|uniref:hypothetical protein n=1 Tax=Thermodesulfovibrio sp. TaxID=2067987 RepID=UPI00309C12F9
MNDLKEIKDQLDRLEEMLKVIFNHFQKPETPPPARVYQLKEKARKKALELRERLKVE